MAYSFFGAIKLTGGVEGSLDNIDGDALENGDCAIVLDFTNGKVYWYWLDSDSAAAESSPGVISPDTNADDKRWILFDVTSLTLSGGTTDGIVTIDATDNLQDSTVVITDVARRVGTPDTNNLCGMDADGDPTDSGIVAANVFMDADLDVAREWTKQQNFNEAALTSTANSVAWDTDTAQCAYHLMTENTTIAAPSNMNAGSTYVIRIKQAAASVYTLAWNAAFDWGVEAAPAEPAVVNGVITIGFYTDGTTLYGVELTRTE